METWGLSIPLHVFYTIISHTNASILKTLSALFCLFSNSIILELGILRHISVDACISTCTHFHVVQHRAV